MTVQQLPEYLKQHWPAIGEKLQGGTYKPQPVKRVEIPKSDGGVQAWHPNGVGSIYSTGGNAGFAAQVGRDIFRTQLWYEFRPGRSTYQAVEKSQQYTAEGYRWVVDLDLKKFFNPASYCPRVHENTSNSCGC